MHRGGGHRAPVPHLRTHPGASAPAKMADDDHAHGETCDCEDHHQHTGPVEELVTVRDWLRYAVTRFHRAGLFFGHGSMEAYDEAAYLILHTLALPLGRLEVLLDACITSEERPAVWEIIERRTVERIPAAYLTHEAWMGEFRFYVDERVIVLRSYFGELLEDGLAPWVEDAERVSSALDLCTGSGCLAILMAHAFPQAHVTAVDLSAEALEVARHNVADYHLQERIELIQSDLFTSLGKRRFDLIISNPPYVTSAAMAQIPAEYRHEPELALAAGKDGLDVVRHILAGAKRHLNPGGVLAVEDHRLLRRRRRHRGRLHHAAAGGRHLAGAGHRLPVLDQQPGRVGHHRHAAPELRRQPGPHRDQHPGGLGAQPAARAGAAAGTGGADRADHRCDVHRLLQHRDAHQ